MLQIGVQYFLLICKLLLLLPLSLFFSATEVPPSLFLAPRFWYLFASSSSLSPSQLDMTKSCREVAYVIFIKHNKVKNKYKMNKGKKGCGSAQSSFTTLCFFWLGFFFVLVASSMRAWSRKGFSSSSLNPSSKSASASSRCRFL